MSQTIRFAATPLLTGVSLLVIGFTLPLCAADNSCKPVFDAMTKVLATPTHLYVSGSPGSGNKKPQDTELIYAGGPNAAIYVKIGERWTRGKMDAAMMIKQEEENRRNAKSSCRYLREEAVNGVSAAVYTIHSEHEGISSDAKMTWISKGWGLPTADRIGYRHGRACQEPQLGTLRLLQRARARWGAGDRPPLETAHLNRQTENGDRRGTGNAA